MITKLKSSIVRHNPVKRTRYLRSDKMFVLYLLGICAIPSIYGQCTVERAAPLFKRAIHDFSIDLVKRISEETENHFVTSAMSSWTLISALSLGAAGDTYSEMKSVLRLHPHKCFNKKFFRIAKNITARDGETVLERNTMIFAAENLNVHDNFVRRLKHTGAADLKILPNFEDLDYTAASINDFVRKATHERIDEIVSVNDIDGAKMIAVDTIYYKGAWRIPFPSSETKLSAFYDESENQIGDVNLMYISGVFNVVYIEAIQANVLQLPFGKVGRNSMLVFLPNKGYSVQTMIENLKKISMASIFKLYRESMPETVNVQLPRFKISSEILNLKELLTDMGLKSMFDSNTADFSIIANDPLFVSSLIQKAEFEVTEEGAVGSAATEAELVSRMLPFEFFANKPFMFMVMDDHTEVAMFTGVYSKPSAY